jgi:hypothetical protein
VGGDRDGKQRWAFPGRGEGDRSARFDVAAADDCRGIEQAELQDSLLGMGCEIGQGFLFSPPLELSLVRERLMAEGSTGLRVVSSA